MPNLSIPNLPVADLPLTGNEITVVSQGGETKKLAINNFPTPLQAVFTDLVANNTTMENTTLILEYGVNIIITSTSTNFACRLPVPTTGKRITVVNNSLMTVSLFPDYNLGPNGYLTGRINNGAVGAPALIPPDGRAYDFVCVENPLPGAWTWSPPATGQYDSGEISVTTTTNAFGSYIMAASSSGTIYAAERSGIISSSGFAFNGLNQPLIIQNTPSVMPNINYITGFKPSTGWNQITKIKIYSNIIPVIGTPPTFTLSAGAQYNNYTAGTSTFVSAGNGDSSSPFLINQIILSNSITGSASPGLAANIGDAGTAWGEANLTPSMFYYGNTSISSVGDTFISTDGTTDVWFTRFISAFFKHRVIGNVKFQFFLEYN